MVEGKGGRVMNFLSAGCFWDYEIYLVNGLASLIHQTWNAAANTLGLLQRDPEQDCFKKAYTSYINHF